MRDKKQQAQWFGWCAELVVLCWYLFCGYRLLRWRWRCAAGEVDILLYKKQTVVAVEVKARAGAPTLEEISPMQRRRIARALALFVAARPDLRHNGLRCDAAFLSLSAWPRYVYNAWEV